MSAPPELPAIVSRAFDVSRRAGYVSFCRNETGRLLATLAATRGGTMAEFGTGSTKKARILLNAAPQIAAYVPVDISTEFLAQEAAAVRRDFPGWDVHALKAEFDTWVAGAADRAPRDYQKAFYGFVKQHHARNKHELR